MSSKPASLTVRFNNQQQELLANLQQEHFGKIDLPDLVKYAIRHASAPHSQAKSDPPPGPPQRKVIAEHVIEPGQGKAIEVLKGQIIRIEQTEGGQCGDFNVYNLHDRNERLHTGRTFIIHGRSPSTGDLLWSNGPHERPLMAVLSNTARTDTMYAACSALLYSRYFGSRAHTNCQEIQAEAQREYGLAPHHVHPSFNIFMYVDFDSTGQSYIVKNRARPSDYIEFIALTDVLAIPNVCGDDYGKSSNFWLRPLHAVVMEPTEEDSTQAENMSAEANTQVLPQPSHYSKRPLEKCSDYVPSFPYLPLTFHDVHVELDGTLQETFDRVRDRDLYGDDLGAAARDMVMSWVGTIQDW